MPRAVQLPLRRVICAALLAGTVSLVGSAPASALAGWTESTLPAPGGGPSTSQLVSISCTSSTACVAVGNYQVGASSFALIDTLSGGSWTPFEPSTPAGGSNVHLTSVSCPDASSCVAVGWYNLSSSQHGLIEQLSNGSWTQTLLDNTDSGNADTVWQGVSCWTAGACEAVGHGDKNPPLVARLASRSWTTGEAAQPSDPQGSSYRLVAVSCTSATFCAAVGNGYNNSANADSGLGEILSGSTWSATFPLDPSGKNEDLTGVSCTDATRCMAGGNLYGGGNPTAVAWTGSSWGTPQLLSLPSGIKYVYAGAISCTSATSCVLVGNEGFQNVGVTETLSGSTWTVGTLPNRPGSNPNYVYIDGVSCPVAGSCLAIGYDDSGVSQLERLNNGTWTVTGVSGAPGPASFRVNATACPSASSCVAVGHWTDAAGTQHALIETLSGGTWTDTTGVGPPGGTYADLEGVSCPTADWCVAVGTAYAGGSQAQALVETFSSGKWSAELLPAPVSASVNEGQGEIVQSELKAVSCLAVGQCTAVGQFYGTYDGQKQYWLLAEKLSGAQWTADVSANQLVDNAGYAGYDFLFTGISCVTASFCGATGVFEVIGFSSYGFALVEKDGVWSLGPIVHNGSGQSYLTGISCPSLHNCVAVGRYQSLAVALTDTDGTWSETEPAGGGGNAILSGVSCPVLGACAAVGNGSTNSDWAVTLSNGTWAAFTPSGTVHGDLTGVSCPQAGRCIANGYTLSTPPTGTAATFDEPTSPPNVTTSSLPQASANVSYSQTLAASGGSGAYTWGVLAGQLPPGLTLDHSTGKISGTPTSGGTFPFTISVADSASPLAQFATKALSITVTGGNPTILTTSLLQGSVGAAYDQTIQTTGGTSPYSFTVSAGSLPGGLQLNSSTGEITGTPTAGGTSSFTVRMADSASHTASANLSIDISPPPVVTTTSLPGGQAGAPYSAVLLATGTTPASWTVLNGSLPPGLKLDSDGAISGTPTTAGTFDFQALVTDSTSPTPQLATAYLEIDIVAAGTVGLTTTSLSGVVNQGLFTYLSAVGGRPVYKFKITSGQSALTTLGVGFGSDGSMYGLGGQGQGCVNPDANNDFCPTTAGTATITVQVTDANGLTGTGTVYVTIAPQGQMSVTSPPLPDGSVGAGYQQTLTAVGGKKPYSWAISSGSLPPGVSLDPNSGTISGIPTSSGNYNFTVKATDSSSPTPLTAHQNQSITVHPASSLVITTSSLPGGQAGSPYSQTVSAAGGKTPYSWSISAGALPAGLKLSASTGALSGLPTAAGEYEFTVEAKDSSSPQETTTRNFAVVMAAVPGALIVSTATLPPAALHAHYTAKLAAQGGKPPYAWALSTGKLPPGLALNKATGVIAGIPKSAGKYPLTVKVTDASTPTPKTATAKLAITVSVPLAITTRSLKAGKVALAYRQTLAAVGGVKPYSWSVSSGILPPGLSLDSVTGAITGAPTSGGTYKFTIRLADSSAPRAQVKTKTFSVAVSGRAKSKGRGHPAIVIQSRKLTLAGSVIRVALSCEQAACAGEVEIFQRIRASGATKRVVLGLAFYSLDVGGVSNIPLTLTTAGRKRLAQAGSKPTSVTVLATVTGGKLATKTLTIAQ